MKQKQFSLKKKKNANIFTFQWVLMTRIPPRGDLKLIRFQLNFNKPRKIPYRSCEVWHNRSYGPLHPRQAHAASREYKTKQEKARGGGWGRGWFLCIPCHHQPLSLSEALKESSRTCAAFTCSTTSIYINVHIRPPAGISQLPLQLWLKGCRGRTWWLLEHSRIFPIFLSYFTFT